MFQKISKGMFMPHFRTQTFLASTLCTEKLTENLICEKCFIFSICGSDPYDFDTVIIKFHDLLVVLLIFYSKLGSAHNICKINF